MKMIQVSEDALNSLKEMAEQDAKDAALWRYSVAIGENQRMNWMDVYDDWDGDGSFADAIATAMQTK